MTYTYHYDSPLGGITLSSNGTELTGLWFDGQKYFGDTLEEKYEEKVCRYLSSQPVGWIFILAVKPLILPHHYICRQHRFAKRYGRLCLQFHLGRQ